MDKAFVAGLVAFHELNCAILREVTFFYPCDHSSSESRCCWVSSGHRVNDLGASNGRLEKLIVCFIYVDATVGMYGAMIVVSTISRESKERNLQFFNIACLPIPRQKQ